MNLMQTHTYWICAENNNNNNNNNNKTSALVDLLQSWDFESPNSHTIYIYIYIYIIKTKETEIRKDFTFLEWLMMWDAYAMTNISKNH